jgi:hypothetical protein
MANNQPANWGSSVQVKVGQERQAFDKRGLHQVLDVPERDAAAEEERRRTLPALHQ